MSLTTCLKKAGSAISEADKAAIIERARELRGEGMKPTAAASKAVAELLAAAEAEVSRLSGGEPEELAAAYPAEEAADAPAEGVQEKPAGQPAAEVENFGEALPPARRNMAAKLSEDLSDSDIASKPLSEIWPLSENEAIEDTFAAAVAHAAHAEIPAKPRVAYKVKGWVQKVKMLRDLAGKIVSGAVTRERMAEKIKTEFRSLADWWSKVMLLEQIDRGQWKRIGEVMERPESYTYEDGKQVAAPMLRVQVDGKSHWLRGDVGVEGDARGTIGGNRAGLMALLVRDVPEQRMEFDIRTRRKDGGVFINKKGDGQYRPLMEFATVADARKAIAEQYDALVAAWEGVKARDNITERDLRSAENRPRAGRDHRQGRDVTPQEFQDQFGFRGGEFGKWVQQGKGDKERQAILNDAYDALMDLSDLLGIPPRAISLNGTLGIAFGSRGSGWASAHFEPSNLVINLTKTRGAGALGHEWFHALDNYFSRIRRDGAEAPFTGSQRGYRDDNYITHRPEPLMVHKTQASTPITRGRLEAYHAANPKSGYYNPENWKADPKHPAGVRPEVEERFAALVQALDKSPMSRRAKELDGIKESGDGYWSRTLERAARAFENYLQGKMQDEGYHNDFLANVVASEDTGRNPDRYPYLLPAELKPIREAFDALFSEVKAREDDAGNVALLSRSGRNGRGISITDAEAIAADIRATMPTAPQIVVVESVSQLPDKLRRLIEQAGAGDDVEGVYWGGKVYAVTGHFNDLDRFRFVVAHHELRHHGFGAMLGPRLHRIMMQIYRSNAKVRELADKNVRDGIAADVVVATEEALADMPVEELTKLNFWASLKAAVREFLRTLSMKLEKKHPRLADMLRPDGWTDEDIARLISRAEDMSRTGEPDYVRGGAVFSRADQSSAVVEDLNRIGNQLAAQGYATTDIPNIQATRKLAALVKRLDSGEITDEYFALAVKGLAERMQGVADAKAANRVVKERERGADIVREKLIRARRRGELDPDGVEFALWALGKNPALADNLGISIRAPKDGPASGDYNPAAEVIRLFKSPTAHPDTAVHEILHHAERMMPPDMQDAIRREWSKGLTATLKKATPEQRESLKNIAGALAGDEAAYKALVQAINEGPLNYWHYQFINPSEYWAVNATHLLGLRYKAGDRIWVRVLFWLNEMEQKVRSLLGLPSDTPVLKALKYVTNPENFGVDRGGRFESPEMLSDLQSIKASGATMMSIRKHDARTTEALARAGINVPPSVTVEVGPGWRDELGRLRFAPGQALYDMLGKAANPMLIKLGLKAASPELKRLLREMRLDVRRAQDVAVKVATEGTKLSDAERELVSDIIEKEMAAGTVPPEHAVRLASAMSAAFTKQSAELVELGMLSEGAKDRWEGQYLPRYYESKMRGQVADAWSDAVLKLTRRASPLKGIRGKHLKGRGLFETIPADRLPEYEAMGWEVRDDGYTPGETPEVQVWRDFTKEERDDMGEVRDAVFRFVMGYMQTQKDIALGRLFKTMAEDDAMSSRLPRDGWVRVPTTEVDGADGVKRYGKLAGRFVPQEVLSHLTQIEETQSAAWQMYRKAMGIWKEGKTVLNPVAHANNVLSNLTMAHFGGVSYHRADKYLRAVHELATNAKMVDEARNAGLFLSTMSAAEMMNSLPDELKELAAKADSRAMRGAKLTFDLMTWFLRKPLGKAYEAEDMFFRYLLYREARGGGMEPGEAVDYATRFIFTYDDLPKGARMVRDFAMPFFAYTYKAIPALAHTAMVYPHRFLLPAAGLWAANAIGYAISAGGDDDWWGSVQKYLGDSEFRAKAQKQEALERKHLPEWQKGMSALATPKAIRLGTDELTGLPLFLDAARIIPGGDLFDVSPNAGGVPLPQPLTPSHPILNVAIGMLANKDLFTGKELVDMNDDKGEAAAKRGAWLWKQAAPAISIGNYHWERAMQALAHANGGPIMWMPGLIGGDATGIGKDGLPVQPGYAAAQTFGIKVRPFDLERSMAIEGGKHKQMIRSIDAELSQLRRLSARGAVSAEALKQATVKAVEKKQRLLAERAEAD